MPNGVSAYTPVRLFTHPALGGDAIFGRPDEIPRLVKTDHRNHVVLRLLSELILRGMDLSSNPATVFVVLLEHLYMATTALLAATGLMMVAFALRAYAIAPRSELVHLAMGFTLIAGAATATAVSAFIINFQRPLSLLTVNYGMTALGYLFVVYSLTSYIRPSPTEDERDVPEGSFVGD